MIPIDESGEIDSRKNKTSLEVALNSDDYTLLRRVGKGSWGEVFEAKDNKLSTPGKDKVVAIKVYRPNELAQAEMQKFGLNPLSLIKNEGLDLKACSFVVPRRYEEDKDGQPFLVMPFYPKTLNRGRNELQNWNGKEHTFFNNIALGMSKDLVHALAEIHGSLGIVHGDWKDENVLYGDGKWMATDFSLSPIARSLNLGEDRGHRYTRAPECFSTPDKKGLDVNPRADVFGNSALIFSLYNGNAPLEGELRKLEPENFGKFISNLSVKDGNKIIREKIKRNGAFL